MGERHVRGRRRSLRHDAVRREVQGRGTLEYSCGSDGPCTQSPTGNCKGRCEDEVPRCKNECDDPCTGERCNTCKASCESNGGYMPRPDGKAPMWEGDTGSCKNQCPRFYNSPTYQ